MIKAILFDCGGVLIYPKGGWWQRAVDRDEILGHRKIAIDEDRAKAAFDKYAYLLDEGQLISGLNHENRLREQFLSAMNRELDAGLSDEEVQKIARSLTYNDARYQPYEDTLSMLPRLGSAYRIGFLSNAMPSMVRALTNLGMADGLDCFTVSCLIGCQKPEEGIYQTALKELALSPQECIFVEDLEANLKTAARLGLNVIRMKRPFYYAKPVDDFDWQGDVATNLSDVEKLISAHNAGQREIARCGA